MTQQFSNTWIKIEQIEKPLTIIYKQSYTNI